MDEEKSGGRRWFTYMVRCRDGSLYTGYTADDTARRVAAHNAGRGARYTASRLPVSLVWSQCFTNAHDARSWEAKIKRWPKKRKERMAEAGLPVSLA